jgi:outer membrane protein OmpA-like peptidoglycan-associated protein
VDAHEPAPAPSRAETWRTYVPERCRDVEGNLTAGCRGRRVITTSTSIEILEPIGFADNTAEPTPASHRTIAAVARLLIENPSILTIEVRGHSDSLLHPADRAELARRRAEAVAALIVAHGVAPERLSTYGASDSELRYPADDARNRRVEFVILARDE